MLQNIELHRHLEVVFRWTVAFPSGCREEYLKTAIQGIVLGIAVTVFFEYYQWSPGIPAGIAKEKSQDVESNESKTRVLIRGFWLRCSGHVPFCSSRQCHLV
ncbi:MAG: hypothetical protein C5B51_09650 [Terriglobia bacterium]|nr:MAG: hypothetical protein C5B51_09650 [Terriglobia bacterium]